MAKKAYGYTRDKRTGKVTVVELPPATKAQQASLKLIPFTKAPGRIARALWP